MIQLSVLRPSDRCHSHSNRAQRIPILSPATSMAAPTSFPSPIPQARRSTVGYGPPRHWIQTPSSWSTISPTPRVLKRWIISWTWSIWRRSNVSRTTSDCARSWERNPVEGMSARLACHRQWKSSRATNAISRIIVWWHPAMDSSMHASTAAGLWRPALARRSTLRRPLPVWHVRKEERGGESRANDWIALVRRVVEARRLHGQHGALPQCAEPSHNSLPTTTEDAIAGETRSRRSRAWEFIKHRKTTEPNGKQSQEPSEIQRIEKQKVSREKCYRGCCVCQLWCFHCSCWWIMRLYIKKRCRLYYTLSYIFLGNICVELTWEHVEKHGATQAHLRGE